MHKNKGVGKLIAVKRWQIFAIGAAVLGIGAYFYFNGGLGLGRRVRSLAPAENAFSGQKYGASSGGPARMVWQTVPRPDAGFRVDLPAEPKELQVPAFNESGGSEPVKMIFATPDADTTFAVSWQDNPPVARANSRIPEKTLDAARDGMLARTQTFLDNETRVTVMGFAARDILAHNGGGGVLNARLIYTGERLYTLMALFPTANARREQDVVRFFNSFSMGRTTTEKLPAAPGE